MPAMNTELHYLTKEEIHKLLSVIAVRSARDYAIWSVAYWHGLRASEVGKLQLSDWRGDTSRLFVRRAKGSNSGEYLCRDVVAAAIKAWLKVRGSDPGPLFPSRRGSRPISRQRLHNLMREYCELAHILHPRNHFHVLRHSIAVHMADKGIGVAQIQDWLGHKDITSTMVYVKITAFARSQTANLLYTDTPREDTPKLPKPKVKWTKDKPSPRHRRTGGAKPGSLPVDEVS